MKTSFAAISCLVVAVLAQTNTVPASDATSPAPEVANTPIPNVVIGQTPQVAQMPHSMTQSLLARLSSYFDMSHLSSVDTATPVMTVKVFDPTMNKYTLLSMNVVQSGDVWYLPVCTINSITTAGSSAAPPLPESCQFAIQLTPVPQNAMRMMMRVMRTMVRSIEAAAIEPTRYMFGRASTGMTYMPMQ
ncbi:hypothetical protein H4S07_000238 [Coemansia furcata]|uniref:Uncharacterized protein n=1 Tax=Coemansia furcata TaxID=417177 RepID=A0ACC1LRM8_9FUNG|nr:hypothetical protein H4S07_000238 [Coemansia furcata]